MATGPTFDDLPNSVRDELWRLSLIARIAASKPKERRRLKKAYRLLLASKFFDPQTQVVGRAHADSAFKAARKLAKKLDR
jgi:hypothetical protein